MIIIRKATLRNFNAIYNFVNALEETIFDKRKQHTIYKRNLASRNNVYLVAKQDNEVVGFLSCHVQFLLHHSARVAEIQEMFVAEKFRSKGIGKKLLDDLKMRMKKRGVAHIEAVSNRRRKEAHKFYEREKFHYTSRKFVFVNAS
jgi:(aminoalkyl)phosphonate N-acetyltransferase